MIKLHDLFDVLQLQAGEFLSFSAYAADLGGFISAQFGAQDREAAEDWVSRAAQVGGSVWVTPNPTRQGVARASDADVTALRWQLVDFDPVKTEDDPQGLDEDKREACARAARELWEHVGRRGALVDSGRGWQCWLRVAEDVERKRLRDWVCEWWGERGVYEVDKLGQDPSRLCRCPGVVNPRTGDLADIEETPGEGVISADEVRAWLPEWTPAEPAGEAEGWDTCAPTAEDMALVTGTARELWDDVGAFLGDRSSRQHAFLCEVLKAGASVEDGQACRLWWALPEGKAAADDRNAAYWYSSLRSARASVGEQLAQVDALATLHSVLAGDADKADKVDALLSPAALELAATLAPADYAKLRLVVKAARCVALADWEKWVAQQQRRVRLRQAAEQGPPDAYLKRLEDDQGNLVRWIRSSDGGQLLQSEVHGYLIAKLGEDSALLAKTAAQDNPWRLVSEPFQPRELEGRRWNVSRAQRVEPAAGDCSAWLEFLQTIGRGGDEAAAAHPWCQASGIASGGDYFVYWLANMFQRPKERVPWIVLYSLEQGLGKSMFHEAVSRYLFRGSGGVVCLNRWLASERGFNAEAEGAVFGYVEEENVAQYRQRMLGRMKQIVTADELWYEGKGQAAREGPNYLHVVQCCNDPRYVVIEETDTRITALEMLPLPPEKVRPKAAIMAELAEQAPAFMAYLLALDLPATGDGRLALPALETELKRSQGKASKDALARWLEETPAWVGMPIKDLHLAFIRQLPESESPRAWPIGKVESALDKQPKGLRNAHALAMKLLPLRETGWEGLVGDLPHGLDWPAQRVGKALKTLADLFNWVSLGPKTKHGRTATVRRLG